MEMLRFRLFLSSGTHFVILIGLLSLFGCSLVLSDRVSPTVQESSVNATGMVACQFAAAHHPKVSYQKSDRTLGDASVTARRDEQVAVQDCHRRLTGPH
jgi:hypothetical protein